MKKMKSGKMPESQTEAVDQYLSVVPEPGRTALRKLRAQVKEAAPVAVEVISYGMPGFKYHGYLAGFAAFKDHLSFFPGASLGAWKSELDGYKLSKGTIQFTPEKPIPARLVKKIIRARVKELEERALGVTGRTKKYPD